MKIASSALFLLITALAGLSRAAEDSLPEGLSSHPAAPGGLAFTVQVPRELVGKSAPLVVLLHEEGFTDRDFPALSSTLAEEGGYVVLSPRAGGLGFTDRDLEPLLSTVSQLSELLEIESVHLLGIRDSARQAALFGFARPKAFQSVVMLSADVPHIRPSSAARGLRVLALKTAADRPAAGREAVLRIREQVEVAEFRQMLGDPRKPDPATRQYVRHFIDAAAGRANPERDRSFKWRSLAAGLAERGRRKVRALVYLYDDSGAGRTRTRQIQNEVLFDAKLRAAAKDLVPILAPRGDVGKLDPNLRLKSGPALVVIDEDGKIVGVLQRNLTAGALLALLRGRVRTTSQDRER